MVLRMMTSVDQPVASKALIEEQNIHLLRQNDVLFGEIDAVHKAVYRSWWECLKESEDYAAALRGERGEPFAGVAADFGELFDVFEIWWLETGRLFFGQQAYAAPVSKIDEPDDAKPSSTMAIWLDNARPNLYLRIPLTLDRKEILRQVDQLVDWEKRKRSEELLAASKPRRALYPDQRIRRDTIENMLALWRARKSTDEPWWQTGERMGLWPQFTCQATDGEEEVRHKHRIMTLTLQRLHKSAAIMIKFAAMGDFPRMK